jgi:hypothetical protein
MLVDAGATHENLREIWEKKRDASDWAIWQNARNVNYWLWVQLPNGSGSLSVVYYHHKWRTSK